MICVETAVRDDVKHLRALDKMVYPDDWCVDSTFSTVAFERNPEIYRVVRCDGVVKGYYALFPVPKSVYEALLVGEIEESDLSQHIQPFYTCEPLYVYLASIVVDMTSPARRDYSIPLLKDMPHWLYSLKGKGTHIAEIGAIAISEHGERVLNRYGMTRSGLVRHEDGMFNVYLAPSEQFLNDVHA